jgi:hypothetical protein
MGSFAILSDGYFCRLMDLTLAQVSIPVYRSINSHSILGLKAELVEITS